MDKKTLLQFLVLKLSRNDAPTWGIQAHYGPLNTADCTGLPMLAQSMHWCKCLTKYHWACLMKECWHWQMHCCVCIRILAYLNCLNEHISNELYITCAINHQIFQCKDFLVTQPQVWTEKDIFNYMFSGKSELKVRFYDTWCQGFGIKQRLESLRLIRNTVKPALFFSKVMPSDACFNWFDLTC